jgi:hypothetical protein
MDRYDERKDISNDNDDEVSPREGDILGLGGSTVPHMPGDPTASNDPESVRRRRTRAMGTEEDPHVDRVDPYQQGKGAAGTDMGAAGRGTDIKPE